MRHSIEYGLELQAERKDGPMSRQFLSPNPDPFLDLSQGIIEAGLEEALKDHPGPWRALRSSRDPDCYEVKTQDNHVIADRLSKKAASKICALARKVVEREHLDLHLDAFDVAMKLRQKNGKRKGRT